MSVRGSARGQLAGGQCFVETHSSSSCCQQTFQKQPLGAVCFVRANLGFKFKPKNKIREAVPNVVIVKPSYDDEPLRTNAQQARNAVRQPYCEELLLCYQV